VTLDFVDLRRGYANRYSWIPPFDSSVANVTKTRRSSADRQSYCDNRQFQ
jgi:hypothetical protein